MSSSPPTADSAEIGLGVTIGGVAETAWPEELVESLDRPATESGNPAAERPEGRGRAVGTIGDAVGPSATRLNLRASMADGATFGVMVGVGESYLAAFALAIGLGEISAGLVSSVPLLVGGVLQLVSLRAVGWLGSEKRWIVCCATLQGLSFIPLVIAALSGSLALVPLLMIASLYWAGGLASGPPWNTWMESIVPSRIRPRYFARRTRTSQMCTVIGLVGGGLALQWADDHGRVLLGFGSVFAVAALFRLWSVSWLMRHRASERDWTSSGRRRSVTLAAAGPATESSERDGAGGDGSRRRWRASEITGMRLLSYLVAVQAMVQISGPYFAPYMLKQLEFSYTQYVTLLAVGFISKVIALSWWGRMKHRDGAKRLLWIGGVGIVPLSALWIVSDDLYVLAVVQLLSGVLWAAYELGFFLMFFETLPIAKRTRMLTYYNLANMLALCGGAFIGAAILQGLGGGQSAYWVLFATSSVGRGLALGLLFGIPLASHPAITVCLRVVGVRLSTSAADSPILSTLSSRPRD